MRIQEVIVGETHKLETRIRRSEAFTATSITVTVEDLEGTSLDSDAGSVDSSEAALTHYLYFPYTPLAAHAGKAVCTWTYTVGTEILMAREDIIVTD